MKRVLEIERCGDCPKLDTRWSQPPWDCECLGTVITDLDSIHEDCPLDKAGELCGYCGRRPFDRTMD